MINLDNFPRIKNDLSGNLTTAQYLVAIKTDPVIYISTTKQMFQSTDGSEGYGGNLLQDSGFNYDSEWILSSSDGSPEDDVIIEDGVVKFLGNGVYSVIRINDILEIGEQYRVTLKCLENSGGTILVNDNNPYISIVPEGQTGTFEAIWTPENNTDFKIYMHDPVDGQDYQQQVSIDNVILQKLGIQPVYYEDLDLKVSNIKEKIDLKTKKIQLSSMSLSFNNFPVNDVRLSDRMGNGLGKEISVYLKTASCESIEDCVKVADLKINRYSHDKNTVKISADDKWLESFYVDLPRTLLEKDVNTFEAYNLKPVPILYGHLENAPALPYYSDSEDYSYLTDGVKVLPDSSYLGGGSEIQGVKQWNQRNSNGVLRYFDEMEDLNVLKIKLSDSLLASVPIKPYINTAYEITELHKHAQYFTLGDHIKINIPSADYNVVFGESDDDISLTGLWCSHLSKMINKKISVYNIASIGNWISSDYVDVDEMTMKNIMTSFAAYDFDSIDWWEEFFGSPSWIDTAYFHKIGIFDLEFEQISGMDVYENEVGDELPRDVQFLGNGYVECFNYSSPINNNFFIHFDLYAIYSPYHYDPLMSSINNRSDELATPSKWNFTGQWTVDGGQLLPQVHRNRFRVNGVSAGETSSPRNYISSFNSRFSGYSDEPNTFRSRQEGLYPILNSNNVALYYTYGEDSFIFEPSDNDIVPQNTIDVKTDWSDVKLRKYWKNKDIFEKDFFVNAKGRVSGTLGNSKQINAEIAVWYESIDAPDDYTTHENKHLIELYKALTDSSMKYKNIGGEVHEMVLRSRNPDGTYNYAFDFDVNNFYATTDISNSSGFNINPYPHFESIGSVVHYYGWIFEITAKIFGDFYSEVESGQNNMYMGGVELGYAKKNIIDGTLVDFGNFIREADEDSDGNKLFNGVNKSYYSAGNALATISGYTRLVWFKDEEDDAPNLLESPEDIIANLVSTEMGLNQISVSMPTQETNMAFGFSINEQENSKDIIENICAQSNLFFRYSPRDGQAIIDTVKRSYSNGDVDKTIATDRILKYSFGKTKIDDLCFGGCTVKWGYDYGKEELANITEPKAVSSDFINQYLTEYGVEDSEKYKLEIEAPYINNEATALKFRDFMFHFYKNTHLTIKATLPIQEGIELEVGDVVGFDSNIGGLKPYGRDMYQSLYDGSGDGYMLIDQRIYPYFLITSVSKTLDKVDIEVMQLHNLIGVPIVEEDDTGDDTGDDVQPDPILGCTNPAATNYNPDATEDDGGCVLPNNAPVADFEGYGYDSNGNQTPFIFTYGGYIVFDPSTSYDNDGEIVANEWTLIVAKDAVVIQPNDEDYPIELLEQVENHNQSSSLLEPLTITPLPHHAGFFIGVGLIVTDNDGMTNSYGGDAATIPILAGLDPDALPEEEYDFVAGDVNNDGVMDILDIVAVTQNVLGNTEFTEDEERRADINGDGIIDILDIIFMMNIVMGED